MTNGTATNDNRSWRLPRYAWGYAEDLREDYLTVTKGAARQQHPELFSSPAGDLTWAQLYLIEAAILHVQPASNLNRVAWRWRLRLRNIAGTAAYQAYVDSKPPDPSTSTPDEIRADLSSLAAELHYRYLLAPARENARDKFYLWSFLGLVAALAVTIGLVIIQWLTSYRIELPVLAIVLACGWVGGLVSVQQRLQSLPEDDPLFGVLQLTSSKFSILFSPLLGAVFAALLYLFFAGNLLSGQLFPLIATPAQTHTGVPFHIFADGTRPSGGIDWAKLVIWSFIAGFGERFVPDILDRLVQRAQNSQPVASGRPESPDSASQVKTQAGSGP